MKRLLIGLTFFLSFAQISMASCLGSNSATILDLGGFKGIDSVIVVADEAFVSLSFEMSENRYDSNGDKIDLHGLAKIDVSDTTKFKKYDYNNYTQDSNGNYVDSKYYQTKYLEDIANITSLYLYGKDFSFDSEILGTQTLFILDAINIENGDTIAYGYTNDSTNSNAYLWRINLTSISDVVYKKYENASIEGSAGDNLNQFYLIKKSSSDEASVIKTAFSTNFTNPTVIYTHDETTTQDWITASMVGDSEKLFVEINKNTVQINTPSSTQTIIDINSSLQSTSKLIYSKCSYLFYSSNFEYLNVVNLDTNQTASLKVWDPYNAVMSNDMLYMTNMGAMVNAINVSNPMQPTIENNTSDWGHTDNLFKKDNTLYVTRGWSGLSVYDTSGCTQTVSDTYVNCQETNTTQPTTSTTTCSCITTDDLNSLPDGWSLLGSGCDISDMSIFNNFDIVWYWDNGAKKWLAYSSDSTTVEKIQNINLELIMGIESKKGFWVHK